MSGPASLDGSFQRRAEFLAHSKMYDEAREAFEDALCKLERDRCLINSSSELLRKYMALYKHFQDRPGVTDGEEEEE